MDRRDFLRTAAALALPAGFSGCGGGGNGTGEGPVPGITEFASDKAAYGVGESALLSARFEGVGCIEPGNIPVVSGTPVPVGPLLAPTRYRLVVSLNGREISRSLVLQVAYRNVFSPVAMGFARTGHVATPDRLGRVLILGGTAGGGAPPAEVFAFDAAHGAFSPCGLLSTGRTGHTATLLGDGSLLVFGGSRSLSGTPVAERFDPRTGISRPTSSQPASSRSYHTATLLHDGLVLIAGGSTPAANAASDTVDIFDPQSETFTRWPAGLATKRFGHHAVLSAGNTLLLYGGVTPQGQAAGPEVLDLYRRTSTLLALPPHDSIARLHTSMATVGDDSLVLGGESFLDGLPLATIAGIAAGQLALRPGGSLRSPRSMAAAAPLADGNVLVTGGMASPGLAALSSTEILSPSATLAMDGAPMSFARSGHTATTMSNGKVLVVGGAGPGGEAVSVAELYS